ncbi:hypothetical protein BDQ17DRAFT_1347758 [Cyathus striatus]|nr:hypothetical protein BDQ17DRAFT_1347758 [Cyathus striatus]
MDHDISEKNKRLKHRESSPPLSQSKFFAGFIPNSTTAGRQKTLDSLSVASSSRLIEGKENVVMISSDLEEEELPIQPKALNCIKMSKPDASDLTELAPDPFEGSDLDMDEPTELIEQEDGYISPTPSYCLDAQDLSSPPHGGSTPFPNRLGRENHVGDENIEADILSSPMSAVKLRQSSSRTIWHSRSPTPTKFGESAILQPFASDTPIREHRNEVVKGSVQPPMYAGPNLLDFYESEINISKEKRVAERRIIRTKIRSRRSWSDSRSGSTAPPTPSPETPLDHTEGVVPLVIDVDELSDYDDQKTQTRTFINGWKERWALNGPGRMKSAAPNNGKNPGGLKRNETNITPSGRHSLARKVITLHSAPAKSVPRQDFKPKKLPQSRKCLALFGEVTQTKLQNTKICDLSVSDVEDFTVETSNTTSINGKDSEQLVISRTQQRLTKFRYARMST